MAAIGMLSSPFPAEKISWRVGATNGDKTKGLALAYIDARDVMERLDEACGPAGWQCTYPHANGKTVCSIGIKIDDEWIWKSNGAGDTDVEAEKGALSDAFKRAAVMWGIGRYLYDVESPWVAIKSQGRSYVIDPNELPRLHKLLRPKAPAPDNSPDASDEFLDAPAIKEHVEAGFREGFKKITLKTIASMTTRAEMMGWWNSDEQKAARQAAGLTQADVDGLKDAIMDRLAGFKKEEEKAA